MGAPEASGKRGEQPAAAAKSAARLRTIAGARRRYLDPQMEKEAGAEPNRRAKDGSPQIPSNHKDVRTEQ